MPSYIVRKQGIEPIESWEGTSVSRASDIRKDGLPREDVIDTTGLSYTHVHALLRGLGDIDYMTLCNELERRDKLDTA